MTTQKQYFDKLKVDNGYVWAINEQGQTPLEIRCIGTEPLLGFVEVVIQQDAGGWWYSQKKFNPEDAKRYIDGIMKELSELDKAKWQKKGY